MNAFLNVATEFTGLLGRALTDPYALSTLMLIVVCMVVGQATSHALFLGFNRRIAEECGLWREIVWNPAWKVGFCVGAIGVLQGAWRGQAWRPASNAEFETTIYAVSVLTTIAVPAGFAVLIILLLWLDGFSSSRRTRRVGRRLSILLSI